MARHAVDAVRPGTTEVAQKRRQLLIDVSIIASHDAGTGIQRVVRSILLALFESPPNDMEIRLVKATRKRSYVYAQNYFGSLTGAAPEPELPVVAERGDIFLGLDLSSRIAPRRQRDFLRWKKTGVSFAFVVYDVLPILHPQWFTTRASRSFRYWFSTISIYADALFCISGTVATEMESYLAQRLGMSMPVPKIAWFHLGAEPLTQPIRDLNRHERKHSALTVLMVGTVEPRKGYAQILDAFELLWSAGIDTKLIIVGRQGWNVDELATRLQQHVEAGKRMQWISTANDSELAKIYELADGLVMASEAEGFGLPLIEAARYGMPLFVRDVAVFREVAGNYATYFHASSGAELAPQLERWLNAITKGQAIGSTLVAPLTWQASAENLKSLVSQLGATDQYR